MLALVANGSLRAQISDPNIQVREARDFHAISVSGAFDVFLTQGNEEKVAVSAEREKDLAYITVEVSNGVLKIGWDHRSGKWSNGNRKLRAYISFRMLNKLEAGGASDVAIVGGWKADEAEIVLGGASDVKGTVNMGRLSVNLSGASDGKLEGRADQLTVKASGASSFKSYDLVTENCKANASGASDIRITVNTEIIAEASGASDIHYRGRAISKEIRASGASSVSHS